MVELTMNDYRSIFMAIAEKLNTKELITDQEKIKLVNIIKKGI